MEHIPCTPDEKAHCRVREVEGECYEDVHHVYWPSRCYRTIIEKAFRELGHNKIRMCRDDHNEEHAVNPPPAKPTRDQMLNELNKS